MRAIALIILIATTLSAVESAKEWPRLAGQVLVGTAGFEPGVAGEWEFVAARPWRVRPEVFISDSADPGIGVSLGWAIAEGELPHGQRLFLGPRLAYHNDRHEHDVRRGNGTIRHEDGDVRYGFEASAFGQYIFPIIPSKPDRHYIEAIAGLGVIDHDDDADPSITVGAAYAYQF
jgi:hypothetical protein